VKEKRRPGMENKIKMLIAIGAAVTANCQPCLKTAVTQAKGTGAEEKEIREAIAIGRIVRKGAIGKMDKFASTLIGKDVMGSSDECPFGSTEEEVKEWVEQEDGCGCS
jgi:AhpD family alkylhydroperoxidase